MTSTFKHFCHLCGHALNSFAKDIMFTASGWLLCISCVPELPIVLGGAVVVYTASALYDLYRGT